MGFEVAYRDVGGRVLKALFTTQAHGQNQSDTLESAAPLPRQPSR